LISRGINSAFPGFRRAVSIFAVYLVADVAYSLAMTPRNGSVHYSVAEWERDGLAQAPRHKAGGDSHGGHQGGGH
jgi:hypothetical protein